MGVMAVVKGFGKMIKELISYDPDGKKVVKYASVVLKNEKGNDFAHFVPSLFNLASNAASGSFATAKTEAELLAGKGNISTVLRQKAKLEKILVEVEGKKSRAQAEYYGITKSGDSPLSDSGKARARVLGQQLKVLGSDSDKLTLGLDAWDDQVSYLRGLGRDFIQFNAWKTYVEYKALENHYTAYTLDSSPSEKKKSKLKAKLEAQHNHLKMVYEDYKAVLARDPYSEEVNGSIFMEDLQGNFHLDKDKAAQFALRPGTFSSQAEVNGALKLMIAELRGKDLPEEAMILLPVNPNHHKALNYVKTITNKEYWSQTPTQTEVDEARAILTGVPEDERDVHAASLAKETKIKKLQNQIPTQISATEISLERSWYQFTFGEEVLPAVAFVFGLIFTAVTTAFMGAFIFTLFTPLGVPLWGIALMAAAIFVVDLANNRDDWQGRTSRILDPLKRVFNSLFYPERFSNRPNERLSIPRALLTALLLIVIGFDLGAIAAGSAFGFKEFMEEQAIARVHPIGMMIMMVVFGLWVANSMIAPLFGETFSRIGLFFREPIAKAKFDVEKELPLILKNDAFIEASAVANEQADSFIRELEARRAERNVLPHKRKSGSPLPSIASDEGDSVKVKSGVSPVAPDMLPHAVLVEDPRSVASESSEETDPNVEHVSTRQQPYVAFTNGAGTTPHTETTPLLSPNTAAPNTDAENVLRTDADNVLPFKQRAVTASNVGLRHKF